MKRVISGHIHRAIETAWAGTVACTAPSTAHQLVLAKRDVAPLGIKLEAPGFNVHTIVDGNVATQTHVIGRATAPYRFDQRGRVKIR